MEELKGGNKMEELKNENIVEEENSVYEMTLEDFLVGTDIENITKKIKISDRFPDEEKFYFEIKAMTFPEKEDLRRSCTKTNNQGRKVFNDKKFSKMIIIQQTLHPKFNSVELMKKAKCFTPEECVDKLLLSGEQETLIQQISELSGFDNPLKQLVEEAKNL
ncbi:MAG: hypothetical protein RR420_05555 [Anaerovoracaceae bacterium]